MAKRQRKKHCPVQKKTTSCCSTGPAARFVVTSGGTSIKPCHRSLNDSILTSRPGKKRCDQKAMCLVERWDNLIICDCTLERSASLGSRDSDKLKICIEAPNQPGRPSRTRRAEVTQSTSCVLLTFLTHAAQIPALRRFTTKRSFAPPSAFRLQTPFRLAAVGVASIIGYG